MDYGGQGPWVNVRFCHVKRVCNVTVLAARNSNQSMVCALRGYFMVRALRDYFALYGLQGSILLRMFCWTARHARLEDEPFLKGGRMLRPCSLVDMSAL